MFLNHGVNEKSITPDTRCELPPIHTQKANSQRSEKPSQIVGADDVVTACISTAWKCSSEHVLFPKPGEEGQQWGKQMPFLTRTASILRGAGAGGV